MAGAAGATLLAFGACYPATAVRLELGTDVACDDRTSTAVFVTDTKAADLGPAVAVAKGCAFPAPHNIGSVVLVPRDAKDASMRVEAVLARNGKDPVACRDNLDDCVVGRRIVAYQKHSTRALPVTLSNQCLGVRCPETQTCVAGECVGADVDAPGFCAGDGCDAGVRPPPPPPPPAPDAGDDGSTVPPDVCGGVLATGEARPTGPMRVSSSHVYWATATGVRVLAKQPKSSAKTIEGYTLFAANTTHLALGRTDTIAFHDLNGAMGPLRAMSNVTAVAAVGTKAIAAAGGIVFDVPPSPTDALTRLFTRDAQKLAISNELILVVNNAGVLTVHPTKPPYDATHTLNAAINNVVDVVAAGAGGAFLSSGTIYLAGPTSISPTITVVAPKTFGGVAMDAQNVYYTVRSENTAEVVYLRRATPGTGGGLATGLVDATAIAADGQCVYFWQLTNNAAAGIGEVVAVPRP